MNYSKNVDQRIEYHAALIARLEKNKSDAENTLEGLKRKKTAYIEAGKFEESLSLEPQIRKAGQDLEDLTISHDQAITYPPVTAAVLLEEWAGQVQPMNDKAKKLQAASNKAFSTFLDAIETQAAHARECNAEKIKWGELLNSFFPVKSVKPSELFAVDFPLLRSAAAIYANYRGKISK